MALIKDKELSIAFAGEAVNCNYWKITEVRLAKGTNIALIAKISLFKDKAAADSNKGAPASINFTCGVTRDESKMDLCQLAYTKIKAALVNPPPAPAPQPKEKRLLGAIDG